MFLLCPSVNVLQRYVIYNNNNLTNYLVPFIARRLRLIFIIKYSLLDIVPPAVVNISYNSISEYNGKVIYPTKIFLQLNYTTRRFGSGRPIAPYLSPVDSTFYIRIFLFVPLIFLDSAVFYLPSNLYYFS